MVTENQCYFQKLDHNRWKQRILVKHKQWENHKNPRSLVKHNQRKKIEESGLGPGRRLRGNE